MRKLFTYVLVAAAAMAGFTSCSDDNNDPQLFELPAESKTMTPSNGLTFVSNGQSLSDVTLQYVPAADGKSAILDIFGSNASRAASRAESPVIAPGDVLPGAASVSINVTAKFEADRATFEGEERCDHLHPHLHRCRRRPHARADLQRRSAHGQDGELQARCIRLQACGADSCRTGS